MRTTREYIDTCDHNGEHQQIPVDVCVHEEIEEKEDWNVCVDCGEILDK